MKKKTYVMFGSLPKRDDFMVRAAVNLLDAEGRPALPMTLGVWPKSDDGRVIVEAVNQGIDAHLEAIQFKQGRDEAGRLTVTIRDTGSVYTLLRRLLEIAERELAAGWDTSSENHPAENWVTDILDSFGYEHG